MADRKFSSNISIKRFPGDRVLIEPDEEAAAASTRPEGAPSGDTFRAFMPATLFFLSAPELLPECEREQLEEAGFLSTTQAPAVG